VNVFSMAEMR
jgi:hypothetical protein